MTGSHEPEDWYNDWAALIAQGELSPLLRPVWWLWRLYNATRPTSILGRLWHLCVSWFIVYVVFAGAFLQIPKDRVGGAVLLGVGVLAFCQACGRRKVKIVGRAEPAPRLKRALRAVPEPAPGVRAPRGRRGRRLWQLALVGALAGLVAVVVQHGFHV